VNLYLAAEKWDMAAAVASHLVKEREWLTLFPRKQTPTTDRETVPDREIERHSIKARWPSETIFLRVPSCGQRIHTINVVIQKNGFREQQHYLRGRNFPLSYLS
jgi:hypothetical protein